MIFNRAIVSLVSGMSNILHIMSGEGGRCGDYLASESICGFHAKTTFSPGPCHPAGWFTERGLSTAHTDIVQAERLSKATESKVSYGTSCGWRGLPFRGINCPGQGSVQLRPGRVVPENQ